ncbi:MAG: hypothetical protein V4513_06970 [Pseudomonadota bacterium]
MIQRIAATITATLILWFVWWFFGVMFVWWISSMSEAAGNLAGVLWWIAVVAIPPLVWFRFRHVQ